MVRELVVDAEGGSCPEDPRLGDLRREFPSVRISSAATRPGSRATMFRLEDWLDPSVDLFTLDARVESERAEALGLTAGTATWSDAAAQILTRYQWRLRRRNEASATRLFDAVLDRHLALHALDKPLVRADLIHALDVWQWMLRLDPDASLAAQIAALFHDVERLASEADARVEHRARDYRAFKRAHAREGARMLRALLRELGAPTDVTDRAARLVARHEEPGADRELRLLNDADALSFFSRNSDGFVRYYGLEHTRTKVRFTLARLGEAARARVVGLRMRPEIWQLVEEETRRAERRGPPSTE